MIISEINSYFVKNKKEITTTGVGVIQTLYAISLRKIFEEYFGYRGITFMFVNTFKLTINF